VKAIETHYDYNFIFIFKLAQRNTRIYIYHTETSVDHIATAVPIVKHHVNQCFKNETVSLASEIIAMVLLFG